jgi:hypothetical protein
MDAIRRHLGRGLLIAAAAAALAAPSSAQAAFAKLDAGKVTYTAISGEANDLTATYSSAGVAKLSEAGRWGPFPILIAGSGGCGGIAALITCNGAGSLVINTVAPDCETVDRGAVADSPPAATPQNPGGTPTDPGGGGDPQVDAGGRGLAQTPYVNFQPPEIPRQTVTVSPSGVAPVQVVCPPGAGACKGTVQLVLGGRSSAKARMLTAARRTKHARGVVLGKARFTAKAGEKPVVQVRLNRRGRRRILRTRHTRCRIVVTTRSAAGKVVTTTRTITLRARRAKGGRKR